MKSMFIPRQDMARHPKRAAAADPVSGRPRSPTKAREAPATSEATPSPRMSTQVTALRKR